MAGYTRQSVADIIANAIIKAAPVNAEFNAIRDAFNNSTGHKHDGTSAEGTYVPLIADLDANNKVVVDTANNRISVFTEVSGGAVEQLRIIDGAIVPVTDNDIDLGSNTLEFKNLYIDGSAFIDTLAVHENATVAGTLGVTGLSTLASADINGGTIDGTTIGASSTAAGSFTTVSTSGQATLASADINGGTVDGTVIGGTTAAAITGTTITATTGITGDVEGDVTGNLTGNVTGNVTGNLTGNVTGNVTAATGTSSLNDLTVSGNTILGNAATDTVTVAADVASDLIPSVDSTYTLGDASNYWSSAHIDTITTTGNMTVGGGLSVIGTADFTNTTLNNVSDPTTAQQAATKAYVDAQVSGLVDAAPGALDTLNELAAAIGDDANFSTTVTNSIATKLPLAGGTMTGNIALGGYLINGAALTPTTASELTSKSYVDSILGSATAVSAIAAAAAATYDAFDDRYLGSKTSAPTLDNDGDTLLTGALYWDSASGGLYVWNGASWELAGQRDELLQAIGASKAVTAVDVFVYDTSKDSDGGAWRKRTQGTSWYNETLNTATRGSRKEFPAVAVIVAETNKVTIYDGDDPALPMWMVFNANEGSYSVYGGGTSPITAVAAVNGEMAVSAAGTFGALSRINFPSDGSHFVVNTTTKYIKENLLLRNSTLGMQSIAGAANPIVNRTVNDVAMTVLPDAPIDAATGLPVPTIRVGTAGGISVIENDGTVTSFTSSIYTQSTSDNPDYDLWQRYLFGRSLLVGGSIYAYMSSSWYLAVKDRGGNYIDTWATGDSSEGAPVNQKFTQIAFDPTGNKNHMSCGMTASYCSGWMPSLIKGAFLSDTDDTDLVGVELVTNGTFDSDLTGWTEDINNAATVSDGVLTFTDEICGVYQTLTGVTSGQTYLISGSTTGTDSRLLVRRSRTSGTLYYYALVNGDFNVPVTIASGETQITVALLTNNAAATGTFDNISVKTTDADRSVNNNGLAINGTVTRTPVATGADLVAYSGFSASNYLEQPYNSDLDFGTGDFCVMGWASFTSTGSQVLLSRIAISGGSRTGAGFQISNASDSFIFDITDDGYASFDRAEVPFANNTGVMQHICCLRSGSNAYIYVNGVLVVTQAIVNAAGSLSNATATLTVGAYPAGTVIGQFPWGGSLSLWRISATAPSAEQIAKMYNDEKFLFQENAQATLYGTSDAVTALAHDSDTNLLHVGTSAGRSVFQGLRRVSNTTTAVGTAISASNGLVVEE